MPAGEKCTWNQKKMLNLIPLADIDVKIRAAQYIAK